MKINHSGRISGKGIGKKWSEREEKRRCQGRKEETPLFKGNGTTRVSMRIQNNEK